MSFLYYLFDKMKRYRGQLKDLICLRKLDILALSETWIRESDDSAIYTIEDYNFLRVDRCVTGWRWVGRIIYKYSLPYSPIDLRIPLANSTIEIVGAVIHLHKKRIAVFSVYYPP